MANPVISLSGGQSNTSINGSLGGDRSDTTITTDIVENFIDNITRAESILTKIEYRCGYIYNPSGATLTGVTIELTSHPTVTNIAIGLDPVGKGDGRTNGVATSISAESNVPTGVKFFGFDDEGKYAKIVLPIGTLKAGECVAFWIKRTTESGPQATITFNLAISHDGNETTGHNVEDGGATGELLKVTTTQTRNFVVGTARVNFSDVG